MQTAGKEPPFVTTCNATKVSSRHFLRKGEANFETKKGEAERLISLGKLLLTSLHGENEIKMFTIIRRLVHSVFPRASTEIRNKASDHIHTTL
jgi:hypothetical protein